MSLTTLQITDFRNISTATFNPLSGLNLICGKNGSGKTSLLESIHYLGLGRSFRTAQSSCLIRHQADKFSLFAQIENSDGYYIPVGVERHMQGALRLRMAENDMPTIAEIASLLPLRMINSQSHQLFELGPSFRRKYLDWGLFYQTHHFLLLWRQFDRVLKQRNTLLRDKHAKNEIDVWTNELVKIGTELDALRRDYIKELIPFVEKAAHELLGLSSLNLEYQPGWDESDTYENILNKHFAEEWRAGYTLYGPHRADLLVTIETLPVKHFLSRGQLKLLICAMIVAQGMLLKMKANNRLIYLIDDLPSELDSEGCRKLITLLSQQPTQMFITAIEQDVIQKIAGMINISLKMFHVEHGFIEPCE